MMLLTVATSLLLSTGAAPERPTLAGVVLDAGNQPVAGALVFITTAKPREGTSTTCPSCYLDCRKRATTNAKGEFSLPKVDPTLLFQVAATAEGHLASYRYDVDPVAGPLTIKLGTPPPTPDDPRCLFRGRVVDAGGAPVLGALVTPNGTQEGTTSHFGPMGVDPTITGASGRFTFFLAQGADALFLSAEAAGLAPKAFARIPTGTAENALRMGPGRAIQGRLVQSGRPVAGAVVGVAQVSRNLETFVGERTAETDATGRFLLLNLPPDENLVVYGKVEGLGSRGAFAERALDGEPEGSVRDLAELDLAPGLTLSGRVVLADGRPLPANARLTVARQLAWDWVERSLGIDGTFRFESLPRETMTVSIRLPGYELAPENESVLPDLNRLMSLAGRLDEDTQLTILLKPVADETPRPLPRTGAEWMAFNAKQDAVRAKPLRGVPTVR